jgi:flavin reductase (DIM6/NTAB) family NADH-FMN oxidoreductase RutF
MAVDEQTFRHVMGRFATGVTVLTTGRDGVFHGMTVNAFASTSLRPPLVVVSIDHVALSHDAIAATGLFALSFLSERQRDLSDAFADPESDANRSLDGVEYDLGELGLPLLQGCVAWLECRVGESHVSGDHTLFVADVVSATAGSEDRPLVFYGSDYRELR